MGAPPSDCCYYFAYGSNMFFDQMVARVGPPIARFPGVLTNHMLCFNKVANAQAAEGYANVMPFEGDAVCGVVYAISAKQLDEMDKFEGHPEHYARRRMKVHVLVTDGVELVARSTDWPVLTCRGSAMECVVYVAMPEMVADGLRPTKSYFKKLLLGREYVPRWYVDRLLRRFPPNEFT